MTHTQVLVRNKKTGEERPISYRSYIDTQYLFDLLGQIDEKGNLIAGSPNLSPEHRQMVPVKRGAAVDSGIRIEPVLVKETEVKTEVQEEVKESDQTEELPKVKNKPGPKPKTVLA